MENSHAIIGIDYLVEVGMIGRRSDVMFLAKEYDKALSEVKRLMTKFKLKSRNPFFGTQAINFKKVREDLWSDSGELEHGDLYVTIRRFQNGYPIDKWLLI